MATQLYSIVTSQQAALLKRVNFISCKENIKASDLKKKISVTFLTNSRFIHNVMQRKVLGRMHG